MTVEHKRTRERKVISDLIVRLKLRHDVRKSLLTDWHGRGGSVVTLFSSSSLLKLLALLDHKVALLGRVVRLDREVTESGHDNEGSPPVHCKTPKEER
jgi:hypothetical protein